MSGKAITAVLQLNTTPFLDSLIETKSAVNNFKNSMVRMGTDSKKVEAGITAMRNALSLLIPYLNTFKKLVDQTKTFNSFASGLKKMSEAVMNFSNVTKTSQVGMIRIKEIITQWANAVRGLKVSIDSTTASEQKEVNTLRQLRGAYQSSYMSQQQLANSTKQVANATKGSINNINQYVSATNRATASTQRQTSANRTATASTNQLTTATSRLGKAMSSLRMMGSMVGSMLAYNFAHKLLVATGETIHAKSEMEGYFKMLNFGQGEIQKFNNALDQTVSRFQRVNKYSLGETISSIGVEFNLTTDEMIKAMDVTSMITSEYLRAGRNPNEAALAVKDVLQGQFQRLSRETGVKGEQLKAAGWNGDVTDVNSLLDALRKVGEDRNWDVFAEKANSLNDILTILQNRFGEWAADMVNIVQPSIVSAFNSIMMVGGAMANVLSGVWEWLNGDGLVETATRWTLIGTSIIGVTSALVSYRTGANLVQMVQMGLRGSLMATVFGLKAEEVALYGSRNALISKITSLKAEQVAEMGVRKAILTKVLGLNAEMVANSGLKGAIMSSVLARKLEEAQMEGATVAQKAKIVSDHMEELSSMSTLKAIIAKIAGVEMETFSQKGLVVALAQRIAQSPIYIGSLKAEEIAELSTAQAGMVLMASIAPLVAIFIGLAAAVYAVVKPLQDASAEMKAFNNIAQNGEEIVKSHRKTYNSLSESYNEGYAELQKLTKGTDEYIRKENELETLQKDVKTAQDNVNNSYEAYQRTVSAQAKYEEESGKIRIRTQTELADAYIRAGFSAKEASEMSSKELQEAEKGAYQLRKALQMLKLESDRHIEKNDKIIDMLDQYGLSDDKIREFGTNLTSAQAKIDEGLEKFMTSEDWMERIGGWFEIQQGRLEEWWTEFNAFFEVRDWASMGQKLIEGFDYISDWIFPWKQSIVDGLKAIEDDGLFKAVTDALFGEGDSDGAWDIASQFFDECVSQPIQRWWSWFWEDPIGHTLETHESLSKMTAKFLFGKNEDRSLDQMITDWFNDNVSKPIGDWINGFFANPLAYIGNFLQNFTGIGQLLKLILGEDPIGSIGQWLTDLFSGGSDFNGMMMIDTSWIANLALSIGNAIINFDWIGALSGLVSSSPLNKILTLLFPQDGGVSILEFVNTSLIQPLALGIQTGIANIPILGNILQMLGLVPQANPDAQDKGSQLARAFGNAVETTVANIPILGDVLRFLGVIPQANGDANAKGHAVGDNIKQGEKQGQQGTAQNVASEMSDVVTAISGAINNAFSAAQKVGSAIWDGINSILKRASPGFIHDQVLAEFGTDIPNAISSSGDTAYSVAQGYAQNIKQGIADAGTTTIGMDGMVADYESDAQTIATSSQMMGMTTTTAFNDMSTAVNSSTSQMGTNVASTYTSMQTKQSSLLNTMKTKNSTAYNEMYQKSNQSLIQMRDSTTNITHQMTNAWNLMKNNIVASANRLKSESTVHFNQLSNTIGSFYRKIQNPSNWGAGPSTSGRSGVRRPSAGRPIARTISKGLHGAGPSTGGNYRGSSTMSIAQLKRVLCPNGDCGNIFDGYNITDRVDVQQFINAIEGEHGFGSWSGWNKTHYNYIKTKSDAWSMKSPTINLAGGIPTNANYKVGDFENGQPKISFSAFQSMAESIFSAIPYRHYYDSSWKGSWLGALQAGACNCSDGADALIAFAGACGFGGHKVHGTWDGEGHFWAVINGKPMDTTAWQNGYGWTSPKVHGYGPATRTATPSSSNGNEDKKVINITVQFNEPVYGVDDLDTRIKNGVKEGLREEFNDPYTIAI